jgi:hypothetical protein
MSNLVTLGYGAGLGEASRYIQEIHISRMCLRKTVLRGRLDKALDVKY